MAEDSWNGQGKRGLARTLSDAMFWGVQGQHCLQTVETAEVLGPFAFELAPFFKAVLIYTLHSKLDRGLLYGGVGLSLGCLAGLQ